MIKGINNMIGVSVIVPVYNSEEWIEETLNKLFDALEPSSFDAEVIVVNDGSTDKSAERIRAVAAPEGIAIRTIDQSNTGRYLARKAGVQAASKDTILFLDSRVHVEQSALKFLSEQLQGTTDQIWNGHVHVVKKGNPFARFWDAVAFIGWRRYFRHPRTTSYSLKDFDYYPKGTGFFFVPRQVLEEAMKWFEANTNDVEHSSDDTLLIRHMNESHDIHLSPGFACFYHARSTFGGFLKHAYHRGEFFIDGFLRPGTRFYYPLLMVLALSVFAVVALMVFPFKMMVVIAAGVALLALGLFSGAKLLGVPFADALSLGILGVPFTFVYLAGLWTGVWRKIGARR